MAFSVPTFCHFYGKQNNLLRYKTRIKSIWDFLRVFLFWVKKGGSYEGLNKFCGKQIF